MTPKDYEDLGFKIMAAASFIGFIWNRLGLSGIFHKVSSLEIKYDGVTVEYNKVTADMSYSAGKLDQQKEQAMKDAAAAQGFLDEINRRRATVLLASAGSEVPKIVEPL